MTEKENIQNELLDIMYNQDDYTTSDLQGVVSVLVEKAFLLGVDYAKKTAIFNN